MNLTALLAKPLAMIVLYVLRALLDLAIIGKVKSLFDFILDFCYISVIFSAYTLTQINPPSGFYIESSRIINEASCYALDINSMALAKTLEVVPVDIRTSHGIYIFVILIIVWVICIALKRWYDKILPTTNLNKVKKMAITALAGFLAFALFMFATVFQ